MNEKDSLVMRNISKKFPGVLALDKVDFTVKKQSVHAVVGQNGAGKSTLMNIISGTIKKDSGEIFIDGEEVKIDTIADAFKEGIAYMHQEISIIPDMTVAENIFIGNFPTKNSKINFRKIYEESEKILSTMGIKIDPKRRVKSLGVGEQQILMIARILQRESKIIIMDEPTTSLDAKEVENLFNVIRTLLKSGQSIIYISHYINEIFEISDEVTVIRNGKKIITEKTKSLTEKKVIEHMLGYEEESKKFTKNSKLGKVILETKNLSKPGVLENINFQIREGEIIGLAGHLGSKRTELLRALFGADASMNNEVYIDNEKVKIKSPTDALNLGVGMLTEERHQGIIPSFPIKSNVTLSNLKKISSILGINFRKEEQIAKHYIKLLNIMVSSVSQVITSLSGGNQQKVIFSKLLNSDAKILLLDEPTKGIDIGAKLEILRIILELAKNGIAIILVSSEFTDLVNVCNRVLVLKKGRIVKELEEIPSDKYLQAIINE